MTKTALITGASSGLGAEFASQLAAQGWNLILTSRHLERLEVQAASLRVNFPIIVTTIQADLSDQADINLIADVILSSARIDMLINNAGFGTLHRFSKLELETHAAMVNLHVTAPVLLTRAALPGMISRNSGAIINVSSIAGLIPIRTSLYGSTKAFLISFSTMLQTELRQTDILVQALCPGFVVTGFHDTPEYAHFSRSSLPDFLWMTPAQVVSTSLRQLKKNKLLCIPGSFYWTLGTLAQNSLFSGIIKAIGQQILFRSYRNSLRAGG